MPDRRDLSPLRHLPRSVILNYLRQACEARPRGGRAARLRLGRYPLSAVRAGLAAYLRHRLGPRHAFPGYGGARGGGIHPLTAGGEGDAVRVAIAGDWASGTDEAAAVADAIGGFRPHFTLHLGDTYYVGEEAELRAAFLGEPLGRCAPTCWPRGSRGSFALNGNHEMYARGCAYFDVLLPALGCVGGPPQGASFFCLENAHWRIVALDTGYNSVAWPLLEELPLRPFAPACDLNRTQLRWLRETLRLGADARGVVILTHHPPCSRYADACPAAARQLRQRLRGPVLWFCGHEHRLAVYDRCSRHGGIESWCRNVGHGGMPVELEPRVADERVPLLYTDTRRYPNDEGIEVGYNGYAALTFSGAALHVEYRDLHGDAVYREGFSAAGGGLQRLPE
jgi:hypothetical protein